MGMDKLLCVGMNYRDHCAEQVSKDTTEQVIRTMDTTVLNRASRARDTTVLNRVSRTMDATVLTRVRKEC
jgi:hypothetical protein